MKKGVFYSRILLNLLRDDVKNKEKLNSLFILLLSCDVMSIKNSSTAETNDHEWLWGALFNDNTTHDISTWIHFSWSLTGIINSQYYGIAMEIR